MKKTIKSFICLLLCLSVLLSVTSSFSVVQAMQIFRSGNFFYTISRNEAGKNYATITAYDGDDETITIPSTLDGQSVKYIRSLSGATKVKRLVIPHGVIGIGTKMQTDSDKLSCTVLAECDSLEEIKLSDSVEYIGAYAFFHCTSLKSVNFENAASLKEICTGAFAKCRTLDDITTPDSLITIGDSAFSGCKKLKTITLNKALRSIGDRAFAYCGLREFYIPSGVRRFGQIGDKSTKAKHRRGVLHGCKKLREINVNENNLLLSSIDGILFSKDGSLLCFYPPAKKGDTYTVPMKVKEICDFAFNYSTNLTNVIVADSITKTNKWTFYRCQNINSVAIAIPTVSTGSYTINNNTSTKSAKTQGDGYKTDVCSQMKSKREIRLDTSLIKNAEKLSYTCCNKKERTSYTPKKTFEKTKIVLLI